MYIQIWDFTEGFNYSVGPNKAWKMGFKKSRIGIHRQFSYMSKICGNSKMFHDQEMRWFEMEWPFCLDQNYSFSFQPPGGVWH